MQGNAYTRPGFGSVTPYLMVHDAPGLIDFLARVFDAEELRRDLYPDGRIMNCELRIGSSIIELSEANETWPPTPAALHVYVPDTDAAYTKALAAGAVSLYAPADMPYGERSAGVRDAAGNQWFLATFQAEAKP